TTIEGSPTVDQLYAEYYVPKVRRAPYPIVMVHGNWQTGTNFTGTPDGREGWAQYFLRRGYTVYVVDQIARGRSPHWGLSHGATAPSALARTEARFTAPQDKMRWPQARRHTQWPGRGHAGDAVFDAFYATQFPSVADHKVSQTINRDGIVA